MGCALQRCRGIQRDGHDVVSSGPGPAVVVWLEPSPRTRHAVVDAGHHLHRRLAGYPHPCQPPIDIGASTAFRTEVDAHSKGRRMEACGGGGGLRRRSAAAIRNWAPSSTLRQRMELLPGRAYVELGGPADRRHSSWPELLRAARLPSPRVIICRRSLRR